MVLVILLGFKCVQMGLWFLISLFVILPCEDRDVMSWIERCKSQDSGQVSIAINALRVFDESAFNQQARAEIGDLIVDKTRHLDDIILIAGWLGLSADIEAYERTKENHPPRIFQRIQLAKLRAGNTSKLTGFLKNVKEVPIDDEFNYTIAPLVAYTRQKPAVDYLLEVISMRISGCSPGDAESSGNIDCAYRLVEMVAPIINEFPYELNKSGDIKTDDYPSMLEDVRNWITVNKASYTINNRKY